MQRKGEGHKTRQKKVLNINAFYIMTQRNNKKKYIYKQNVKSETQKIIYKRI